MAVDTLKKTWDCLPPFEAGVTQVLITLYQSAVYNYDITNIRGLFYTAWGDDFGELRLQAWLKLYGVSTFVLNNITYVRTNSAPIVNVSNCQQFQGCQAVQQPCKFTNFVNKP